MTARGVQRVDYVRVPVTHIERAANFYERLLGLPPSRRSPSDDWLEFETANLTLAIMTPHTHGYEFRPLPPGTIALGVADVETAKAALEKAGIACGDIWDSGVCRGAAVSDPDGNEILLHCRYAPPSAPQSDRTPSATRALEWPFPSS